MLNHIVLKATPRNQEKSGSEIKKLFFGGDDFLNVTHGVRGAYCNLPDIKEYYPGVESVEIRYGKKLEKLSVIWIK